MIGLLVGKKAVEQKHKEAIVDLGLQSPIKGSRLYATLKGAVDAGMTIPHDKETFPSDGRIKGEHIAKHEKEAKLKDMTKAFEECKQKIMKG